MTKITEWEPTRFFVESTRTGVRFVSVHDWKTMHWSAYFAETLGL